MLDIRDGNLIQYRNRNPIKIRFSQGSELESKSEKRGIREFESILESSKNALIGIRIE